MRFLLVDRVVAFEPGRRVEAVKCFSLQDEALREHFPRRALVPGSLVLEAMVQAAGFVVVRSSGYRVLPLLSMVEDCTLPAALRPGVTLRLVGEVLSTQPKGSMARCEARLCGDGAGSGGGGEVVASAGRVLFAHYPAPDDRAVRALFHAHEEGA